MNRFLTAQNQQMLKIFACSCKFYEFSIQNLVFMSFIDFIKICMLSQQFKFKVKYRHLKDFFLRVMKILIIFFCSSAPSCCCCCFDIFPHQILSFNFLIYFPFFFIFDNHLRRFHNKYCGKWNYFEQLLKEVINQLEQINFPSFSIVAGFVNW